MNSRGIDPDKESVIDIPLEEISDFPNHPFKVKLDEDMAEMAESVIEQFKIPKGRIDKYFSTGTPAKNMEETIIKALELYRKRERNEKNRSER